MPRKTSPALFVVLAVLGFGLVTAAQAATASRKAEAPRKERLITLIQQRRSQMDDLDKVVRTLRGQLSDEQRRASHNNRNVAASTRQQQTLAAQAGTQG